MVRLSGLTKSDLPWRHLTHCPPAFHWTHWESLQWLKVLWDTGMCFLNMEARNLWFEFPEAKSKAVGMRKVPDTRQGKYLDGHVDWSKGSHVWALEPSTPWSNSFWARGMSWEGASHDLLCDWSRSLPSNLGMTHSSSSLGHPSARVIWAGMCTMPQAIPHRFLQSQNTPRRIKPSPEGDSSLWAGFACPLLCCHVQPLNCCPSSV